MKKLIYKSLVIFFVSTTFFAKATSAKAIKADTTFAVKGFHLDLRVQVMKLPALKQFVLKLSKKGINTIIMEWEATYPFKTETLIPNRYAYTRQEVAQFISYCKSLHVDVIPLQQSFGHVEYILRNYRYAALREDNKDYSQVCPSESELNKQLFTKLYADMIATHQSNYIHIGGDETYLLGHCEKCKKRAAETGISRLYFDHIKMLCDIVVSMGKRPIIWADIALKYPDYIHLLPKQTVFIDWNYGWDINRFGDHSALAKSGYEIWGAPSIRSEPDNYFITTWQKHFNNVKDFTPLSKKLGYKGIVMTSWSTSGVYSSVFESSEQLVDLYAIRHVYPINGFNIIIDAYLDAINTDKPLDIQKFILAYCNSKFGISEKQALLFQKALFAAPYKVENGEVLSPYPMSVKQLQDSAQYALKTLNSITPIKGVEEFKQYCLMAAIRAYYLNFMTIEADVNNDPAPSKIAGYLARLKLLLQNEQQLNTAFINLNQATFYKSELEQENQLRNQKIHLLYQRLSKLR